MSRPRSRRRRVATHDDQLTLDSALSAMSDEYIDCRDYGHSWMSWNFVGLQGGQWEQWLKCQRCDTTRKRILNNRGQQVTNGYDYADGYQLKGFGRLTGTDRDALRLAHILRITETNGKKKS